MTYKDIDTKNTEMTEEKGESRKKYSIRIVAKNEERIFKIRKYTCIAKRTLASYYDFMSVAFSCSS